MNGKRILICGATGSIGSQSLEVIKKLNFNLVGFTYGKNQKKADEIKKKFPDALCFSPLVEKEFFVKDMDELIMVTKPDIILNAVVGFEGFNVSIAAIRNGIDLALANKESLVVGGWILKKLMKYSKSKIFPIDSEHSSIYDSILNNKKELEKIYITASGGSFFNSSKKDLKFIKFKDAIKHPNWNMGYKISIDSSTMINKCFEIIEAYYLFGIENIGVIREKTSHVHSVIKFKDNTYSFNYSKPDMKWSIQQSLTNFRSSEKIIDDVELTSCSIMFEKINEIKWKPIKWAFDFIENKNKAIPIIINAANEESIELFKKGKIKYLDIVSNIEKCILKFGSININNMYDIFLLDKLVRDHFKEF